MNKKNQKPRRAVCYARFSSDGQRDESIDAQLRAILDYANRSGMIIVGEYTDRAKSATTDNRPEFLRMVRDSADGNFDAVIVHKLDRFARNRYDSAHYKHQLRRNGVTVYSVLENLDDSPESVIMESVLEGMAEYYSKNLAREVEKGKRENALRCMSTGGPPPLGYSLDPETKKLDINEDEAKIVRLIFRRTIEGCTYGEIVEELNLHGYKTRKGNDFGKNSLYSILSNEKYSGVYIYSKSSPKDVDGKRNTHVYKDDSEIIRVDGGVPAIIDRTDWLLVQDKLKNRKQRQKPSSRAKETYLLRGKIVCSECGGTYIGGRRKSGNGTYYGAYSCNKRQRTVKHGCGNKEISRDYVEKAVLERLAEYVFSDMYIENLTAEYNAYLTEQDTETVGQLQALTAKNTSLEADIASTVELLVQLKSPALLSKLDELEKKKTNIDTQLSRLKEQPRDNTVTVEAVRELFAQIRGLLVSGGLRNINQVIDMYVDKVTVYPDKIEICFNFFPKLTVNLDEGQEDCEKSQSSAVDCGGAGGN